MARVNAVTPIAAIFCLAGSACEDDGSLFTRSITLPNLADAGPTAPQVIPLPVPVSVPPAVMPPATMTSPPPVSVSPPPAAVPASPPDAGAPDPEPDPPVAPAVPRPVLAEEPAAELPRLGVEGGDPRLGVCPGGVVIGVRTTANPSPEVFGQRLTFVEPICGKVFQQGSGVGDSGSLSVTRDDALISWATTDGFFGLPTTIVPDERLIWVLQPPTVCPETTPVVVGLSGAYDPVAPDVVDTAAIRSLFIECAPLVLAPNGSDVVAGESGHQLISNADSFTAPGSETYRSACEGGAVTTQIKVHAGFWLDGFVLGCARLRVE